MPGPASGHSGGGDCLGAYKSRHSALQWKRRAADIDRIRAIAGAFRRLDNCRKSHHEHEVTVRNAAPGPPSASPTSNTPACQPNSRIVARISSNAVVSVSVPIRARGRISRSQDARVVRPREALRVGLLELIDAKPLDQITIRGITIQAKVSYATFFRQFGSKKELLADAATEQVRTLLSRSHKVFQRDGKESLADLCDYVSKNRKLWATLLTAGANAEMRKEFARSAGEIVSERPRVNPGLPQDLITGLVMNGIFDILAWWLRQSDDYATSNAVKLFDSLFVHNFTRTIDIELD